MSDLRLICSRPHPKEVDFRSSRFVVSTAAGLLVSGTKLERGDLIPDGVLSETALRQEYEKPLARIELLEYAATDASLCEACARRGVDVSGVLADSDSCSAALSAAVSLALPVPVEPAVSDARSDALPADLDHLFRQDLIALCQQNGLSTLGSRKQLRDRLAAVLV